MWKNQKKLKWPRNKNTALVTRDVRSYKSKVHPHLKLNELEVKDLIKVAIENIDQSINQTRSEPSTIDENIAQYDDTKDVTHSCNEC